MFIRFWNKVFKQNWLLVWLYTSYIFDQFYIHCIYASFGEREHKYPISLIIYYRITVYKMVNFLKHPLSLQQSRYFLSHNWYNFQFLDKKTTTCIWISGYCFNLYNISNIKKSIILFAFLCVLLSLLLLLLLIICLLVVCFGAAWC